MSKLMEYHEYSAQLERDSVVGQQFGAVLRAAKQGWVAPSGAAAGRLRTPSSPSTSATSAAHEDAHAQLAGLQKRLARLTSHVDNTLSSHTWVRPQLQAAPMPVVVHNPEVPEIQKPVTTPVPDPVHVPASAHVRTPVPAEDLIVQENSRLRDELNKLREERGKTEELDQLREKLDKTLETTTRVTTENEKHLACLTESETKQRELTEELKNELSLVRDTRQRVEAAAITELKKENEVLKNRNAALGTAQEKLQKEIATLKQKIPKKKLVQSVGVATETPVKVVTTTTTKTMGRTPVISKKRRKKSGTEASMPVPVELQHRAAHETPRTSEKTPHTAQKSTRVREVIQEPRASHETVRAIQTAVLNAQSYSEEPPPAEFDVVRCTPPVKKTVRPVIFPEETNKNPSSPAEPEPKLQVARHAAAVKRLKDRESLSNSPGRETDLESAWFALTTPKKDSPVAIPAELKTPEFPHICDTDDESMHSSCIKMSPSPAAPPPPPAVLLEQDTEKMLEKWREKVRQEEQLAEQRRQEKLRKQEQEDEEQWKRKKKQMEQEEQKMLESIRRRGEEEEHKARAAMEQQVLKQKSEIENLDREIEKRVQQQEEEEERALKQKRELETLEKEVTEQKKKQEEREERERQKREAEEKKRQQEEEAAREKAKEEARKKEEEEKEKEYSEVASASTASTDATPLLVRDLPTDDVLDGALDSADSTPLQSPENPEEESAHGSLEDDEKKEEKEKYMDKKEATNKSQTMSELLSTLNLKLPPPAMPSTPPTGPVTNRGKEVLESVLAKRSPRGRPPASPQLPQKTIGSPIKLGAGRGRASPISRASDSPLRPSAGRGRGSDWGFDSPLPTAGRGRVSDSPLPSGRRRASDSPLPTGRGRGRGMGGGSSSPLLSTVISNRSSQRERTTTPRDSPTRLPPSLQLKQLLDTSKIASPAVQKHVKKPPQRE
eukprot:TRINITY_DN21165_c0_g1_i1.p1 TRINITY_DN21165_c0_g1~~TRINITY_DN21165_c0_g1_i1.p1  ORF type:complete len:952 (+),score=243.06 TRINITY_DN21165_c0_g1_i1:73-2928(+)